MTRDPSRIDPILARLRAAWIARPDLRLGQLLTASVEMRPALDDGPDARGLRLFNAECHEFGAVGAPVEWPAPPTAQPPPVLDLDALAEAERAMTAGPWPIVDPNDREPGPPVWCGSNFGGVAAIGPIHYDADEDETVPGSPAYIRAESDSRGIVALRNAAPHLIAEARAAVALRAQICRLVSSQAIESDRLCQHHDADVVALAEVATLRERLAEAKRLGLEACTAWCRIVGSDGDDDGIAAVEKIAAELEAL